MALTDNLISFWELEEATGDGARVDSVVASGNDLTTAEPGDTPASVPQITGLLGGYGAGVVGTNPTATRLTHATNASLSTSGTSFTVAGWLYLPAVPANASYGVAGKYNQLVLAGEWYLRYDRSGGDGTEFFQVRYAPEGTNMAYINAPASQDATFTKAAWHFVAIRADLATGYLRFQYDGTAAAPVDLSTSVIANFAGAFRLGGTGTSTLSAGFGLDQWGFWKRALTDPEVSDLYNSGAGLSYAALAGGPPPATIFARRTPGGQGNRRTVTEGA